MSNAMENDPFLTHDPAKTAGTEPAAKRPSKSGGKGPQAGVGGLLLLVLVPFILFTIVLICWCFLFSVNEYSTYAITVLIGLLSLVMIIVDRNNARKFWYNVGILTLIGVIFAVFTGSYIWESSLKNYYLFQANREYHNVLSTESAAARADAGVIVFDPDSIVDISKSVGFKAGDVYCAAPIMRATQLSRVEYWAVGKDCCGARASFTCDDSTTLDARTGMVVFDHSGIWGSLITSPFDYWREAVRQAEAAYDLTSSERPLFVRWVKNASTIESEYYNEGVLLYLCMSGIFLLVALGLGIVFWTAYRRTAEME
jgi:hypothetical protein